MRSRSSFNAAEELKSFYQTGGKEGLIGIVVRVLDLAGGKLYKGYSRAGCPNAGAVQSVNREIS
jgi:hypothetical protein